MSKEADNFLDAMRDVRPIKADKRVVLNRCTDNKESQAVRRQAASAEPTLVVDPLTNVEVEQLKANAILAFQRSGVQHRVYRQLRLGKYVIEVRLDLHRMMVEQARISVYQFIRDCLDNDVHCALINHGKGEGRASPAVLKSYVAHWLPQIKEVLAFHSAQKHHGGTGATYVMLKKSDKKRLDNHQKRQ
ncbi:Smr domain-containing protein [Candidatus Endobugula sertula]|uniref:Smr domain-containing protein n=1 Tax=Candidatus Endobugula sertula TaxID=62101 RepID=A0A1D2QMW8_9GAMM|nr:Smr domain-containing protein [Candidatus Endobugula sertula]